MITDGYRLFRIEGQPLQLLRIRGGMVTPLKPQPDHEKLELGLYDVGFVYMGPERGDEPLPTNSLLRDAESLATWGSGNPTTFVEGEIKRKPKMPKHARVPRRKAKRIPHHKPKDT